MAIVCDDCDTRGNKKKPVRYRSVVVEELDPKTDEIEVTFSYTGDHCDKCWKEYLKQIKKVVNG